MDAIPVNTKRDAEMKNWFSDDNKRKRLLFNSTGGTEFLHQYKNSPTNTKLLQILQEKMIIKWKRETLRQVKEKKKKP